MVFGRQGPVLFCGKYCAVFYPKRWQINDRQWRKGRLRFRGRARETRKIDYYILLNWKNNERSSLLLSISDRVLFISLLFFIGVDRKGFLKAFIFHSNIPASSLHYYFLTASLWLTVVTIYEMSNREHSERNYKFIALPLVAIVWSWNENERYRSH